MTWAHHCGGGWPQLERLEPRLLLDATIEATPLPATDGGAPSALLETSGSPGDTTLLGYEAGSVGDSYLNLSEGGHAYLADADVTDLDYSQDFSIETLVHMATYTTAGRWAGFVSKTGSSGLYSSSVAGWGIGTNKGDEMAMFQTIVAKVGDGSTQALVNSAGVSGQVHAVMTWDASARTLTLFVNGVWQGASTASGLSLANIETGDNLQVGRTLNELGRDVFMARVWNRLLSFGEVATLWDALDISDGDGTGSHAVPSGFDTTNLLSEWQMNEECDASGNPGTTHLKDTQGNNHLALVGNADVKLADGALALDAPGDGAAGVDTSVTLVATGGRSELASPTGPLHYWFQVDEAATFDSAALIESDWLAHYGEYKPVLKSDTTYYWRVKVQDSSATPQESGYTAARSFTTAPAQAWYVRPEGGSYGSEDGTSYANAWDGFEAITWGEDGVEAGDTLYVCGTHVREDSMSGNTWLFGGVQYIRERGFSEEYPITIRMDYPGDAGHVWAAWMDTDVTWYYDPVYGAYASSNMWNPNSVRWDPLYEDCDLGPDGEILMKKTLESGEDPSDLATGEFCVYAPAGTNKIFIKPHNAGDPSGRIYRPAFGYRFSIGRSRYLVFKNCNFYGTSFSADSPGAMTDIPTSQYITFDGTLIRHGGTAAIGLDGAAHSHWTIENCTIEHADNGIYGYSDGHSGPDYITIRNCTFLDIGQDPDYSGDGHSIGGQNNHYWLVEGNYMKNTGPAIEMWQGNGNVKNNVVRYNFIIDIHDQPFAGLWAHGIGFSGGAGDGNLVYGNIVVDSEEAGIRGSCDGLDPLAMYDNVVARVPRPYRLAASTGGAAYGNGANNIALDPDGTRSSVMEYANAGYEDFIWDYNLYAPGQLGTDFALRSSLGAGSGTGDFASWRTWVQAADPANESHSFTGAPKFLNGSGTWTEPEDYQLAWDSPAIDAGTAWWEAGETMVDFGGRPIYGAKDIGAWEYQPPYAMGTDPVAAGGSARIYGDGMFRHRTAGTHTADLAVAPAAGWDTFSATEARPFWMDLDVTDWDDPAGMAHGRWVETDSALGAAEATAYTIGGLTPDAHYLVQVNGSIGAGISGPAVSDGVVHADADGQIAFTYTGAHVGTVFELDFLYAGDADRDFTVEDGDDLSALLASFGEPAGWSGGDFNNDGTADDRDLSLLLANLGASVPPHVTIEAVDAQAGETSPNPGVFRISRGSRTDGALAVNFAVGGTAGAGDITETLGTSATIPDGFSTVDITATPVDDGDDEGDETLTLTLQAGAGYALGVPVSDTVTIVDNDGPLHFVAPTPAEGATVEEAPVTVETTVAGDHYAFIDWDADCVLWLDMEAVDAAGNILDASSHDNTGAAVGDAAQTSAGRFGSAFTFDGDGDLITLGNNQDFDFTNTGGFTLSAWVYKTNGTDESGVFVKGGEGGTYELWYHGAGRWQFMITDENLVFPHVYATEPNPDDRWIHVAATYDSATAEIKLYVDGSLKHTSGASLADFSNTGSVRIGARKYGGPDWQGKIDDVIVVARALDATEIAALYDAGATDPDHTFTGPAGTYTYEAVGADANGTRYATETRTVTLAPPAGSTSSSSQETTLETDLLAAPLQPDAGQASTAESSSLDSVGPAALQGLSALDNLPKPQGAVGPRLAVPPAKAGPDGPTPAAPAAAPGLNLTAPTSDALAGAARAAAEFGTSAAGAQRRAYGSPWADASPARRHRHARYRINEDLEADDLLAEVL